VPDLPLLDHHGKQVRLYSGLIRGRVVIISFFFTSCTLVCPMQGATLEKLQALLGERMGKEVFFISISKDPRNDTPKRLKEWARSFGVGEGWTLVTGSERVLGKLVWDSIGENLGQASHLPLLLIGNDQTGVWLAADGGVPPADLLKLIERVADEGPNRKAPASTLNTKQGGT
jgi:protein SCO1/2